MAQSLASVPQPEQNLSASLNSLPPMEDNQRLQPPPNNRLFPGVYITQTLGFCCLNHTTMPGYIYRARRDLLGFTWSKTSVSGFITLVQAQQIAPGVWTVMLNPYQLQVNGHVLDPNDLTPLHSSPEKAIDDYLYCLTH